jgi:hypothetical protein
MKATDFSLSEDLRFDTEKGVISFRNKRLVIFDANAIGLLRKNLIKEFGMLKARELFLRFGYQQGFTDFVQIKNNYKFDTEMDLLISGPVIHTWEGIAGVIPEEIEFNRADGTFYFTGIWENSYEAEQHISSLNMSDEPVCWTLMGYGSGWCTAFFGSTVIAIEPLCVGKGDDRCEWCIQPPAAWGEKCRPYIDALKDLLNA